MRTLEDYECHEQGPCVGSVEAYHLIVCESLTFRVSSRLAPLKRPYKESQAGTCSILYLQLINNKLYLHTNSGMQPGCGTVGTKALSGREVDPGGSSTTRPFLNRVGRSAAWQNTPPNDPEAGPSSLDSSLIGFPSCCANLEALWRRIAGADQPQVEIPAGRVSSIAHSMGLSRVRESVETTSGSCSAGLWSRDGLKGNVCSRRLLSGEV
ncbi:hypothetical protein V8F33_009379 [Rhypophila sp. PSN 637]